MSAQSNPWTVERILTVQAVARFDRMNCLEWYRPGIRKREAWKTTLASWNMVTGQIFWGIRQISLKELSKRLRRARRVEYCAVLARDDSECPF
jgi:hypothetical protein